MPAFSKAGHKQGIFSLVTTLLFYGDMTSKQILIIAIHEASAFHQNSLHMSFRRAMILMSSKYD